MEFPIGKIYEPNSMVKILIFLKIFMASVIRPLGNVAHRGYSEQQFVEWQIIFLHRQIGLQHSSHLTNLTEMPD